MFRFEFVFSRLPADATEWKIRMFDFEIYFKVIRQVALWIPGACRTDWLVLATFCELGTVCIQWSWWHV